MRDMWWGPGWFWFVGLAQIVFWVALIALIAALVRNKPRESTGPTASPALTILEERYARGEIERDEFLERRSVLVERARHG